MQFMALSAAMRRQRQQADYDSDESIRPNQDDGDDNADLYCEGDGGDGSSSESEA